MGTCQRSVKRKNGKTCGNNARPGERYCARHGGGRRPGGGSRSRKKAASGDGYGGLFIMFTLLAILAFGIAM
ncbi:hypothetical protein [Embleya sp. NPDC059237]|uniref:hypothetical protein n=1 Tax=Embleya sp. NPDC059237 TaxID=3346784 RepID=UPI0036780B3D